MDRRAVKVGKFYHLRDPNSGELLNSIIRVRRIENRMPCYVCGIILNLETEKLQRTSGVDIYCFDIYPPSEVVIYIYLFQVGSEVNQEELLRIAKETEDSQLSQHFFNSTIEEFIEDIWLEARLEEEFKEEEEEEEFV